MEPYTPNKQSSTFSNVNSPLNSSFASKKTSKLNDTHSDIKSQNNSINSGNHPSADHQQSTPSHQKDQPTGNNSPAAQPDDIESCDLKEQMENIYSEIESSRKEYFNFYNDYRRGGVGEGEYTSRKEKKEIREEKDKDKASITNILTELVNIQQREHQLLMNDKRSKGLRAKYKRPPSNRLEYFIKEHSHKILTFEQLMIKNFFQEWDQEEKKKHVDKQDWRESQHRSFRRVSQGKDSLGNKAKWVLSWKILNDPLARAMLSDRFLEGWHEATFPQWVNPYKLRRLQQEFSYDMRYWKEQKELINNHGSRFDEARSLFQRLSKELVELKVNHFPPSLKKNLEYAINKKEIMKDIAEDKLFQMEDEQAEAELQAIREESPHLQVLSPIDSFEADKQADKYTYFSDFGFALADKYAYVSREERLKREKEARQKEIKEKLASREHKKWMRSHFRDDCLTQSLVRYGANGHNVAISLEQGTDLFTLLQIDRRISDLKVRCRDRGISLRRIYQLDLNMEPSLEAKQILLAGLQQLLYCPEDPIPAEDVKKMFRREIYRQKKKMIFKRTLFGSCYQKRSQKNIIISTPSVYVSQLPEQPEPFDLEPNQPIKEDNQEIIKINEVNRRPDRAAKSKCLEMFSSDRSMIMIKDPCCPQCRSPLKWETGVVYCQNCFYRQSELQSCPLPPLSSHVLRVRTTGLPFDVSVKLPPWQRRDNSVASIMGDRWGTNNIYLSSCPSFGECHYYDFSPIEKLIDTIRANNNNLPVQVRKSTVPSAGSGLFATKKIAPNTLMGVYCGVVGTHKDSNANSDSLFELGWFRQGPNWAPLVVDGYSSNDGTRYVNSKPNEKNNMWAFIGVYRQQLTILYLTRHQVEKDEELFIDYGKNYFAGPNGATQ